MKLLLLIGGLLGFTIGLLFSWAEEGSGQVCLWHACLAAYVCALLMRWWGGAWRRGLVDALRERQSAPSPAALGAISKATKS